MKPVVGEVERKDSLIRLFQKGIISERKDLEEIY